MLVGASSAAALSMLMLLTAGFTAHAGFNFFSMIGFALTDGPSGDRIALSGMLGYDLSYRRISTPFCDLLDIAR